MLRMAISRGNDGGQQTTTQTATRFLVSRSDCALEVPQSGGKSSASQGQAAHQASPRHLPQAHDKGTGDRLDSEAQEPAARPTLPAAITGTAHTNPLSDLDPSTLPDLRRLHGEYVDDQSDNTETRSELVGLHQHIQAAVSIYLRECSIADKQPTILDPSIALPATLTSLLTLVLGGSTYALEDRVDRFGTFQKHQIIDYSSLFQSLLGCAVMKWCFKRLPDGEELLDELTSGAVRRVIESE